MSHTRKEEAPILLEEPEITGRYVELDGYTVSFETFHTDTDPGAVVPGPAGRPLPVPALGHRGLGPAGGALRRPGGDVHGRRCLRMTPGHLPRSYAGTEVVEFSPTEALQATMAVVGANMAAQAGARRRMTTRRRRPGRCARWRTRSSPSWRPERPRRAVRPGRLLRLHDADVEAAGPGGRDGGRVCAVAVTPAPDACRGAGSTRRRPGSCWRWRRPGTRTASTGTAASCSAPTSGRGHHRGCRSTAPATGTPRGSPSTPPR